MMECCPSPDNPVIIPNQKTVPMRKALYAFMCGEVGAAICRAYTLGVLTGLLHLITLWIDYLGYATMHFCQVLVMGFCGAIEIMTLWLNANDGGTMESAIFETNLTRATYYATITFSIVKCIVCLYIHQSFKQEYLYSS